MDEPQAKAEARFQEAGEHLDQLAALRKGAPRLRARAAVFATALHLVIAATLWDRPTAVAIQLGLWIAALVSNFLVLRYLTRRLGMDVAEHVRAAFNVALHVPIGVLCGWSTVSWLFLLFLTALSSAPSAARFFERSLLIIVCYDLVALLTGARWQDALAFSGLSLFIYFVSTSYVELVGNLLSEREHYLRDLHDAQRVVTSQEKLASIGQIAAGVAHEINDPMCFVTANSEALLDDLRAEAELPAELVEYRDEVIPETIDGIARVNSIVDDLRRFSRGEPERFESFDLAVEIQAAVRMARSRTQPGQTVEVELPPSLVINGSPRQLCQVVLNLIVNGLQALPGDGKVVVSAEQRGAAVEVTVSDTGAGMTEETKQRLFEPFYTTKAARQGQGLGLSVVHGIVRSHGGSIEVESTLGEGSRFYLRLPRSPVARLVGAVR